MGLRLSNSGEARSTQDRAELLTTLIDIEIEATPRSPAPPTVH
jgi:hypothetical protein